jgi:tRNA threonylcarbamoyladenosine biosynthesis protein TsaE
MTDPTSTGRIDLITDSEDQTRSIGCRLAERLSPGMLVGLQGELGSGKTRFVQGMAAGFGIPIEEVSSPTFVLCHVYNGRRTLLHVDAYRIQSLNEVDDLGIHESIARGDVVVVEWADKISATLPDERITIQFEEIDAGRRLLSISATGSRASELLDLWRMTDPALEGPGERSLPAD